MFRAFGRPDPKAQAQKAKQELRGAERDLSKEIRELEREEAKVIADMKKAAAAGNKSTATILAKQLIQLRKAKDRQVAAKAQLAGVGHKIKAVAAQHTVSASVKTATRAFATANRAMDIQGIKQSAMAFARESAKMSATEEALSEGMDDALFDEEDEEESTRVMAEVFDELNLGVSERLAGAVPVPSALPGRLPATASRSSRRQQEEDAEAEEELRRLGIQT